MSLQIRKLELENFHSPLCNRIIHCKHGTLIATVVIQYLPDVNYITIQPHISLPDKTLLISGFRFTCRV